MDEFDEPRVTLRRDWQKRASSIWFCAKTKLKKLKSHIPV